MKRDSVLESLPVTTRARPKTNGIPPSIEDVTAYCQERNNGIDAEQWWHFYNGKDWMVGKNKMVNWKSAVITWEKRNGGQRVQGSSGPQTLVGREHQREEEQLGVIAGWAAKRSVPANGVRQGNGLSLRNEADGKPD